MTSAAPWMQARVTIALVAVVVLGANIRRPAVQACRRPVGERPVIRPHRTIGMRSQLMRRIEGNWPIRRRRTLGWHVVRRGTTSDTGGDTQRGGSDFAADHSHEPRRNSRKDQAVERLWHAASHPWQRPHRTPVDDARRRGAVGPATHFRRSQLGAHCSRFDGGERCRWTSTFPGYRTSRCACSCL